MIFNSAIPPAPRRAFATIMAIILVGLVGATLLSLATLLNAEYNRAQAAFTQAQLRQLLTAGAGIIPAELARQQPAPARQTVSLPPSLAADGATLTLQISAGARLRGVDVIVDAQLNGRTAEQVLHYTDAPTGWRCISAKLR